MPKQEYGRLSFWHYPAGLDEAGAREQARRLEARGQTEDEVAARATYLDLLGIAPGERVLDVGCGSGVVTRELARRGAPDGVVVGLDPSAALLDLARELAGREGLADRLDLRVGDARSLPFGDAEFDVVLAVTALSHVPDGEHAIPEMVRVARPGGRVGVVDREGDAFVIAHPDRALTRRIVAAYSDQHFVDSWLGRRLPGLLAEARLRDVRVRGFVALDQDPSGFYAGNARRAAEVAAQAGAISEDERRRWLEGLDAEQAAGRFLAGLVNIFAWGTRPLGR